MPRVTVWNQYFPPDTSATSFLADELVRTLRSEGWTVRVVAGNPSYRPTAREKWRPLQMFKRSRADVLRVRSTTFERERLLGRVANYLSFIALSVFPMVFRRDDATIVMSDPPIVVIPAAVLGRLRRRPTVYWLQDFLPEFLIATGEIRASLPVRLWSRLHRNAASRCSRVIAIGRDMADRLAEADIPKEQVAVIPNGSAIDWEDHLDPPPDTDRLRVLYAGEIGMRCAWPTIIRGAGEAADVADLVLVGAGVALSEVAMLSADFPNIELQQPVEQAAVRAVLATADVLLVSVRRGAEGFTVPSKTYELLGAGRPIVVVADAASEPARLVRELGCGMVVDPDSPNEFAEAMRALRADYGLRREMGANARRVANEFKRSVTLRRIADELYGSIAKPRAHNK